MIKLAALPRVRPSLGSIFRQKCTQNTTRQDKKLHPSRYITRTKYDHTKDLEEHPSSCGLTKKVLKLQQDQRLMSFIMKVEDQYSSIKTNILMLPELPHVFTTYRMVYQEQKHKELTRLYTTSPSES